MENPQLELARQFLAQTAVNLFLTGRAGTGKTTFLHELRQHSPKRMIVVAPTGVAAINAAGVTLHSFFQLPFAPYIPEAERGVDPNQRQETFRFNKQKIAIIRSLDLLVIDEISMVRADVLDAVSDVLRRYRDPRKPFGGVQLLLIGDLQQLAPVVREAEWGLLSAYYDSPFFFESKALKQTHYTCIELQHIYRQRDSRFIEILNRVRDNSIDRPLLDELNQRYLPGFDPPQKEGYITLTSHNHTAQEINDAKLQKLNAPSYTYQATTQGQFPEYLYPTDVALTLKKGAQVMFIKNDLSPQKRYYNGKIGTVTSLDEHSIEVLPSGDKESIAVEFAEWCNTKYRIDPQTKEISEEVEGTFVQYPLKAAWAITIHKSQGLTFERAIIDAADSFSHGQVYVALSRCKTLEGLVLRAPLSSRCMISDSTIRTFCDNAVAHQPDQEELKRQHKAYYRVLLLDLFDFDGIGRRLKNLRRFVDEHIKVLYPKLADQWRTYTTDFTTGIGSVSGRFQTQINQLIDDVTDPSDSPQLAQRVDKGRDYFSAQCDQIVAPLLKLCDVEIDNKTVRKEFRNLLQLAEDQLRIKMATLAACHAGFDLHRHLAARAKALLEKSDVESRGSTPGNKAPKVALTDDILHPDLFDVLRNWRKAEAEKQGVPVYVILSQKALLSMVNLLPSSSSELLQIKGVGDKFMTRYGNKVLADIQDFRVKSGKDIPFDTLKHSAMPPSVPKSPKEKTPRRDTRLVTFELLQEGLTLQEIAVRRELSQITIESHVAALIRQGRLEPEQFVPSDKIIQITQHLKSHPDERLALVKESLGGDFSYIEICFVRSALQRDDEDR